jgi:hypothetical protein
MNKIDQKKIDETLIFIGMDLLNSNCKKEIILSYPNILNQRIELEKNSDWNNLAMALKKDDNGYILHVNINEITYNIIIDVINKISKNKVHLGKNFTIYLPDKDLLVEQTSTIINTVASNGGIQIRIIS